jgi:hypothetical protein
MRDPHKLIERMRLQQSSVHVLGQPVQQVLEKGRSSEGVSAEWNGATEVRSLQLWASWVCCVYLPTS